MLFKISSVSIVALMLAVAQGCPYLAREQEKNQEAAHQNLRRIQANANAFNKPTSTVGAIQIAAQQILQLVKGVDGMLAKFVRLSFHDCVGGCDGCVDLANPSNFGLEIPIDALAPIVEHNKKFLTTGDIWALAGLVAAGKSQDKTTFKFPLQYIGRPQCAGNATRSGPHRSLPSAHFTTKQVVDFFNKTFQFSAKETVAILGSHTLYVSVRMVRLHFSRRAGGF
jgi:Peroxidase